MLEMDNQQYTVNQILDRYERDCLDDLAPRTKRDYIRHIPVLRKWYGERIAEELKPRDFGPFLDIKRGYEQRKKQLAILSSAFTNAVSTWYILDRNVLRDVKRKPGTPRDRLVTDEEFSSMRAISPRAVRLAMDLALMIGQRQGDILALKWSDIKDNAIHLRPSKTGKRLAIELSRDLKKVLGKCLEMGAPEREHVLVTRRGNRYTSDGFRAMWQRSMRRWIRKTGGQRFTYHDLRAMCATKCKDPQVAMHLLGHANISMTMKVYRRGVERVKPLELGQ
jgi:integrase